jgi:hypothetical protein
MNQKSSNVTLLCDLGNCNFETKSSYREFNSNVLKTTKTFENVGLELIISKKIKIKCVGLRQI